MLWEVPEEEPSQELFAEDWEERSGPVRNQRSHDNCSTYVGTDLFSAMRLINKEDDKFRIFIARYLTLYASPMLRYVESIDGRRKDTHHCHGNSIADTLKFIKRNGVPEEDPVDADKDFNCITDAPEKNPSILYQIGDEVEACVSNKLKDLYEALLHQPVGANLHFFHPEFTNIGSVNIYEGPLSDSSTYSGLHTVLITAVKRIKGKLVARVKSSHGTEKGENGYMNVSLTKMILGIGRGNEIYYASFLLTDFTYLEIPRGLNKPEELEKEKGKKRKTHHLPCLAFVKI
ncbi:Protein HEAT-INDUCED TAS1 TARGET 2 [Cardamine amara subsp. amara]|uniref:Protein HEAT-INDUCED TAS1 TARGET 2 n=1 Tax=Cardamine amara subsp. amara TaxID=228776 RepID=A0ABD1A3G9_CARAN